MSEKDVQAKLGSLYNDLMSARQAILEELSSAEPEPIHDYSLETMTGSTKLSSFFGDKDTMFLIHNMGKQCVYCTVWADGFNGVIDHIQDRAAFLLTSPDSPGDQKSFADSRGWRFNRASTANSTLTRDLGYESESGEYMPGVSVIRKQADNTLTRISQSPFGPGDSYCAVFNLFDLVPGLDQDWAPKFSY